MPKIVGGPHLQFERRKFVADHAHQRRVPGSTAGDDKVTVSEGRRNWRSVAVQRQHELADGDPDGAGGQRGCCRDDIVIVGAAAEPQ